MITFSINKEISDKLSLEVMRLINQNVGMITAKICACVPGYIENRNQVISEKIETVKEEAWHKVIRNFDKSRIDADLTEEEGLEHYTKSTLRGCLNDICSSKKEVELIDIDILDGRNRDKFDEYGDACTIYKLTNIIVNKADPGKLDRQIECEEFIALLSEIYLTDETMFRNLYAWVYAFIKGEDVRKIKEKQYLKGIDRELNNELYKRFKYYLKHLEIPDIDSCFKTVVKSQKEVFVNKDKVFKVAAYPVFEYKTEGGVLSCPIMGDYSTSIFDVTTCSMRDGKNKRKSGKVDLSGSNCKISNMISGGKKIYKLRIEDYLDYAFEQTNKLTEYIDTEMLKWCGKYYIFVMPSGQRYGFCKDHSEYMINVKRELLSNIICNKLLSGTIFAMDNEYIYFCPSSKPRYNSLVAELFNGKVIRMKISEANNIEQTASVALNL